MQVPVILMKDYWTMNTGISERTMESTSHFICYLEGIYLCLTNISIFLKK